VEVKVAYVAGPYKAPTMHQIVANIKAAEAVGVALWRMGVATVIPHKNTALLDGCLSDDPAEDRARWLAGDIEILRRCDCLVTVPGWENSPGAVKEVEAARRCMMSVFHWPLCEDDLREQLITHR
jgi:hypothetical protein